MASLLTRDEEDWKASSSREKEKRCVARCAQVRSLSLVCVRVTLDLTSETLAPTALLAPDEEAGTNSSPSRLSMVVSQRETIRIPESIGRPAGQARMTMERLLCTGMPRQPQSPQMESPSSEWIPRLVVVIRLLQSPNGLSGGVARIIHEGS